VFQYQGFSLTSLKTLTTAEIHNIFAADRGKDGSQVTEFVIDPSTPGKVQLDTAVTSFRSDDAALFFYYVQWTTVGIQILRGNFDLRSVNEVRIKGELTIDADNRAVCAGPFIYRADGGFLTAVESAQIEYQFTNPIGVVTEIEVPATLSDSILTTLAATLSRVSRLEDIEKAAKAAKNAAEANL